MMKILVIDDDKIFQITAESALTEEYEVLCVSSAEEAYTQLNLTIPDLILLDVFMPGEDGLNFLHNIKNTPKWCRIPVILITGEGSSDIESIGFENGAEGYLTKPYSKKNLQKYVSNLLELSELRQANEEIEKRKQLRDEKYNAKEKLYLYLLEKTKNGRICIKSRTIASELGISSFQAAHLLDKLAQNNDRLNISYEAETKTCIWTVSRKDLSAPELTEKRK
ncbi:MAG TPA: response regulator [Methanocorpusculum sp.]|nr:response regulator [Methanocorpusculum sp.]